MYIHKQNENMFKQIEEYVNIQKCNKYIQKDRLKEKYIDKLYTYRYQKDRQIDIRLYVGIRRYIYR